MKEVHFRSSICCRILYRTVREWKKYQYRYYGSTTSRSNVAFIDFGIFMILYICVPASRSGAISIFSPVQRTFPSSSAPPKQLSPLATDENFIPFGTTNQESGRGRGTKQEHEDLQSIAFSERWSSQGHSEAMGNRERETFRQKPASWATTPARNNRADRNDRTGWIARITIVLGWSGIRILSTASSCSSPCVVANATTG